MWLFEKLQVVHKKEVGSEEVEHNLTGADAHAFGAYEEEKVNNFGTWKLGRNKDKDSANAQTKAAHFASKADAEVSEPLWLQLMMNR